MKNFTQEFLTLKDLIEKNYQTERIVLDAFPSGSCALDVVINNVIAVLEYSSRLKQFGVYGGKTSVDLYSSETEVFEDTEFEKAKNFYLTYLSSVSNCA